MLTGPNSSRNVQPRGVLLATCAALHANGMRPLTSIRSKKEWVSSTWRYSKTVLTTANSITIQREIWRISKSTTCPTRLTTKRFAFTIDWWKSTIPIRSKLWSSNCSFPFLFRAAFSFLLPSQCIHVVRYSAFTRIYVLKWSQPIMRTRILWTAPAYHYNCGKQIYRLTFLSSLPLQSLHILRALPSIYS